MGVWESYGKILSISGSNLVVFASLSGVWSAGNDSGADLDKWRIHELRQPPSNLSFAAASGADHEDVARNDLFL